jgi:uncharacterized protein
VVAPGLSIEDLAETLDALPSLVAVVGADERIGYTNRAARAWFGRTPEQLTGTTVRELFGDDCYGAIARRMHKAMTGTSQSFERTMPRLDGTIVHTRTDYLPRFRGGRPDGFVAVMTDVTRQARAERAHAVGRHRLAELLELNRAAAGVSDDVLQELFAIGLHLERTERRAADGAEGALLDALSRSIDLLRKSIKQLGAEDSRPGRVGTIDPEPTVGKGPSVRGLEVTRRDGAVVDVGEPVIELTLDECWDMLEADEFGRLAYRLVDEVHMVPINYLVDGRSLLFRTASGSKLLAAALHSDVALEIDWHDDLAAWSVVARGQLRRLPEDEQHRVDALPRQPWIATLTYDVVELVPTAVTGRRFRLQRHEPDHELAGA